MNTPTPKDQGPKSVFNRVSKWTANAFKNDRLLNTIKGKLESRRLDAFPNHIKKANKIIEKTKWARIEKRIKTPRAPSFKGLLGYGAGLAIGSLAMLSVGIMKGALNTSAEIVAQRQMQDQRYARNITMMSRLGYTTGTSSMNKYNHTVGLSQALSRNRHGRGAY